MRGTTYECKRCCKIFSQLSHYKVHMKRKSVCGRSNPADPESDVVPNLDNVKILKSLKSDGVDVNIKLKNSNHNFAKLDNSSHIQTPVPHTVNLVVSFGEEDRSLLQGLLQSNGSQN